MSVSYYHHTIYGIYLHEESLMKFLSEHGYNVDEERWQEAGYEVMYDIPELKKFEIFSADSGGYTHYFGVPCKKEEKGKIIFEKYFPKIKNASFMEITEVL